MGAFRYVLYAAVAVSLGVYAYRAYRRWIAPDRDRSDLAAESTAVGAAPVDRSPNVTEPPAAPAKPTTVKRGMGFSDPTALPSQQESDRSESLVQQVIREEVARKKGLDPSAPSAEPNEPSSPGRSGLFASDESGGGPDRVSVAAALTGVRLPEDLIPLIGGDGQPDPHHVMFISSTGPAASVGRQLGDELERLGYEVQSETDVVAIATKGAVRMRVTLHPDAANERAGGAARFPTAAPNSVVVEFQT